MWNRVSFRLAVLDTSDHDDLLIARELRTPAERLRRGLAAGRAYRTLAEHAAGGA